MPHFGTRSQTNLAECHTDLQTLFNEVIQHFDCSVIEGHRPEAEQNKAYYERRSKLQWPKSKHNKQPAMAADVVPYPIDWENTNRMRYFAGYVLGIAKMLKQQGRMNHEVRWGGDWDRDTKLRDQSFHDLPHFELLSAE